MARLISLVGTLMIVIAVAGMALVLLAPDISPPWAQQRAVEGREPPQVVRAAGPAVGVALAGAMSNTENRSSEGSQDAPAQPKPSATTTTTRPLTARPISHIRIDRLSLDAQVVPARMVESGDALTWEVPKFRAGHAERTAGAGDLGNAVLLGHVSSRTSGNVFADLEEARVGDEIQVESPDGVFVYHVTETMVVDREDTTLLKSTPTPTLTLVTCTGIWNPLIWEYEQRFVVRAELRAR